MSTAMLHPVPGERHPSRHCGGTTTSDAEVAKSVAASFKAFDSGDKGWLNKHDLKCAFISLVGRKPDAREVSTMRDLCPRGEVDLRHFRMFMEPGLVAAAKDTSQRAVHERTIATFRAFDRNDRGYITLEDAVIGFRRVAPGVGEGVVADVFREADLDGDGKVTFKDYARILNLGQLETVASAAASA